MGQQKFGKRPPLMTPARNYITVASTGTAMTAPGVYTVYSTASSTGATPKTYSIAAPRASQVGQVIEINCIKATTTKAAKIALTSASMYSSVSSTAVTLDSIRMPQANQSITLRAMSTAKWKIVYAQGSPTITTS